MPVHRYEGVDGGMVLDQTAYWIACTLVPGLGPVRFRRLIDRFGEAERIWAADRTSLRDAGLDAKVAEALVALRTRVSLERSLEAVRAAGARALTWRDPEYPPLLLETYAPPPVLYVRGAMAETDHTALSVVGTRQVTPYGRHVTERLVADLVAHGMTIVSGLARGTDTAAHHAALERGGRTIAVLGNGVDVVYPAENRKLTEQIVERGAVISEYPMGSTPEAANFPARNRIIAGMTLGTVVVEAGRKSGALITAAMALEMGREVFAVPGNIYSRQSEGTNCLIQQSGAKLVATARDVLEELNVATVTRQLEMKELIPESPTEQLIVRHLSAEPTHIDELARELDLPVKVVSGELLLMELKGLVRGSGGMTYVLGR